MAEQLTKQQQQAVSDRGGKLLVSAAAGSGKTKVLVDRLLSYILDGSGKVNIDDFLIITYTQAAAAELRAKIAQKLNEKLTEQPDNWHLQRQVQRLYMAKISTVHAFCGDILREYAFALDIPGDFRVADEKESRLLQFQVLERMMEQIFIQADPDVLTFVDSQELRRDDRSIPPVILQVYNSARCHLDPAQWLDRCRNEGCVDGLEDAAQTPWGQYLIRQLQDYLDLQIPALKTCAALADQAGNMPNPAALLHDLVAQLETLRAQNTWDGIVEHRNIVFGTLSFPRKDVDPVLVARIKAVRKHCKDRLPGKLSAFADKSSVVLPDLKNCSAAIHGLVKLVEQFTGSYEQVKRSRRVLDFSDLEHKMLDLLLGKKRQGITQIAQQLQERFVEIMVDEYQDTNEVQDSIFSALTHSRQNCFMVGDVKQSIYQFRLADPNIFIDKYDHFVPAEQAQPGQGRKVMLSQNFRSAGAVIEAVNDVFTQCMSPQVGGLVYDGQVMFREGTPHAVIEEKEVELCLLRVQKDTYAEDAAYTAQRITELLDGSHMIRDKDNLRPITPDDIVILLRSPKNVGAEYEYALQQRGIRVNAPSGVNVLETEEVGFLRSFLQVIENPLQDIPLISVLSSRIFCFTADELARIRTENPRRYFYDSVKASKMEKSCRFVETLNSLRKEAGVCSASQLIDRIFATTGMDSVYASFRDGEARLSNLRLFSDYALKLESSNIRQLGQLLDYLDTLEEEGITKAPDYKVPGAVTILSIHKSKGLEFPVVFLCGLSRDFSKKSIQQSVLCHRELGIGLGCVDLNRRVRYPSIAKKAIAARILSEGLSEEMRVLYVAMTRARDRLIMTYAVKKPDEDVSDLANRLDISHRALLTADVSCPGEWVLISAIQKVEAGALFAQADRPDRLYPSQFPWAITVQQVDLPETQDLEEADDMQPSEPGPDVERFARHLGYQYPHLAATTVPSKQTATQLKGRQKDDEVAENTKPVYRPAHWRVPAFAQEQRGSAVHYGNAVHSVMQHIRFAQCTCERGVEQELQRLSREGLVDPEMISRVDGQMLLRFFRSPIGEKLLTAGNVLREFKFSVLVDAEKYAPQVQGEQILLQGVVDCAILEPEGITVLDFKTDRVTPETQASTARQYHMQVQAYCDALSAIYGLPVKHAYLYFFHTGSFEKVPV